MSKNNSYGSVHACYIHLQLTSNEKWTSEKETMPDANEANGTLERNYQLPWMFH